METKTEELHTKTEQEKKTTEDENNSTITIKTKQLRILIQMMTSQVRLSLIVRLKSLNLLFRTNL